MSGNPVRIGDGCATVTGYKLPQPLVPQMRDWEGGSEVKPEVRISIWLCSSWLIGTASAGGEPNFSVKEKDEARLPETVFQEDSLNAFIPRLPESEGFLFQGLIPPWRAGRSRLRAGLSTLNPSRHLNGTVERSVACINFVS